MERESDDPLPIVWIDDEECYSDAVEEVRAENPAAPVLMVRPDMHIGISRRQWEIIERFVDDWTGFPPGLATVCWTVSRGFFLVV